MRIYKFKLDIEDMRLVRMPKGAKILSVQNQREEVCIWAEVDPDAHQTIRRIAIHGTGHTVTPGGQFVGTFQLSGGDFVGHVYDHGEI